MKPGDMVQTPTGRTGLLVELRETTAIVRLAITLPDSTGLPTATQHEFIYDRQEVREAGGG